jgi:heme/copper-type cytochrome/quinol oxidase subunit 2
MPNHTLKQRAWGLLLSGVLAVLVLFIPLPYMEQPSVRHITLDAKQFAFAPHRFEVNYGDWIVVTLTASDVVHGFYLDGYEIEERVTPGISRRVEFVADKAGKFRYRCSVSCGTLHPFMIGELVVQPNLPFGRAVGFIGILALGMVLHLWRKSVQFTVKEGP